METKKPCNQARCRRTTYWSVQQYKANEMLWVGAKTKSPIKCQYEHKEPVKFFLCIFRALTCPNFIVFLNCTFRILEGTVQPVLGLPKSGRYFFFIFIFLIYLFLIFFLLFTYFRYVSFLFIPFFNLLLLILNKNFKIS